jgi:DnaJ-class molecular chaperone
MGQEYKPRRIRCLHCNGSGKLRAIKVANGGYSFVKIDCYECGGQGYKLTKQRAVPVVA